MVGIGMGTGTLTEDARGVLSRADVFFGAKRMVSVARESGLCKADAVFFEEYRPERIFPRIAESEASREEDGERGGCVYALLVSGDTGFYSATDAVLREYERVSLSDADGSDSGGETAARGGEIGNVLKHLETAVIPGISSVSYFFAKCGLPWQDAKLMSCHGRRSGLVSAVRRNRLVFALTGNNTEQLLDLLCEYGFSDAAVHIGENLGSPEETITHGTVTAACNARYSALTVLIVENPNADRRQRIGIEDDAFVRGAVPMTKSEIRACMMSKLKISPEDVCLDVGCGTGSVTVEMALAAYDGTVYGVDVSEEAVNLSRENLKRFQISNAEIYLGRAAEVIRTLFESPGAERPFPDVAFLGGTKGEMREIVHYLTERNPKIRICITAIALETALEALRVSASEGRRADLTQIQTARAKRVGGLHMMMAQNPIFIITSDSDETDDVQPLSDAQE